MVTLNRIDRAGRPSGLIGGAPGFAPARCADRFYGEAMAMAFRDAPADLPEDMRRLLARLH